MSKTYGFRLGENDTDLQKVLESMPEKDRSLYIRTALRHYVKYGDRINDIIVNIFWQSNRIASGIKEVLTILKSSGLNTEK